MHRRRRLETLAAADRRHLEMEWRVARVPAFVDERFRSVMGEANLNKLLVAGVRFAEVSAEPALSVVHFHDFRPVGLST